MFESFGITCSRTGNNTFLGTLNTKEVCLRVLALHVLECQTTWFYNQHRLLSRKCKKLPFILDIIFAKYTINPTLIHHQKTCLEQAYFMNSLILICCSHTWSRHVLLQSKQIRQKILLLAKLVSICVSRCRHFFCFKILPTICVYFKSNFFWIDKWVCTQIQHSV